MRQILAAVTRSPAAKDLVVEKLMMAPPRANEVLVRLAATSICHTDVHTMKNSFCAFPSVLGHEGVGVVEALGNSAYTGGLSVGDRVVMSYASCGSCSSCRSAKPAYCFSHGELNFAGKRADGSTYLESLDGEEVAGSFFQQSSFATHALTNPRNLVKVDVPEGLALGSLAPLGCGVQTGAGAVLNTFQVRPGQSVVVIGCGAVGLSAVMAANLASASRIFAVDLDRERLALASQLGATHTFCPAEGGPPAMVQAVMDATGEGAHYVLDTSGNSKVLAAASQCLAPMGILGMVAPGGPGQTVELECLTMLAGKQFRGIVQGDAVPQNFIPQLLDHFKNDRFPFNKMCRDYHSLDSVGVAIEDMGSGKAIKPIVHLDAGI